MSPYPIHKIYNRGRAQNYKQFGPYPQITKKSKLNSPIKKFFIIESPIVQQANLRATLSQKKVAPKTHQTKKIVGAK